MSEVTVVERNERKKKISKRLTVIICLLVLLILELFGVIYIAYLSPINLKPYLTVSVVGVEEQGKAQIEMDEYGIAKDAARRMWFRKTLPSEEKNLSEVYKELFSAISVGINPENHLKMGDTYTITVHANNSLLEKYKISIRSNSFTGSVKDIDSYETFDAFEDVKVTLSGTNGSGKVTLDTPKAEELGLVFDVDKSDNLSNGDVVTVVAKPKDYSSFSKYGEKFNRVPVSYQKEFEVSDLGEYVTDITDVTGSDLFNQMFDKVKSDYAASTKIEWTDPSRYLGATYVGSYLLTGKTGTESPQNYYYLVYKVTVRDAYTDVYRFARFENISKNADGTLSADINNYTSPSGSKVGETLTGDAIIIDTNNHYLVGFNSEYSLYDKYIEPYETKYTVSED